VDGAVAGSTGQAAGTDIFLMKGADLLFSPGLGNVITVNGSIADDSAASIGLDGGIDAQSLYQVGQGAGVLFQEGLTILNGANTYSGATTIGIGAVLQAQDGVGIHNHSQIVFDGGVLQSSGSFVRGVGGDSTQAIWNGSGGFSAVGGDLTVSLFGTANPRVSWNTAGFVPSGSSLLFGSSSSTDSVYFTNDIDLGTSGDRNITVVAGVDSYSRAVLTGVLSGGASLSINSLGDTEPGVLVLTNASVYTGGTNIASGVLRLENAGALPSVGVVNVDGELDLSDAGTGVAGTGNRTIGGLSGSSTGVVSMGSHVLTVNQFTDTTFSGSLLDGGFAGGEGARFIKRGVGNLTLNGANAFTGSTTVAEGTLTLGALSSMISRSISIDSGAALVAEEGSLLAQDSSLTVNGSADFKGPFVFVDSVYGAGLLNLTNSELIVSKGLFSGNLTQVGTSHITKEGDGDLTLSGDVTVTGQLTVNAGNVYATGSKFDLSHVKVNEDGYAETSASTTLRSPSFEKSGIGLMVIKGLSGATNFTLSEGGLTLSGSSAAFNVGATVNVISSTDKPDASRSVLVMKGVGDRTISTLNVIGGEVKGVEEGGVSGRLTATTYNLSGNGQDAAVIRLELGSGIVNVTGNTELRARVGAATLNISGDGTNLSVFSPLDATTISLSNASVLTLEDGSSLNPLAAVDIAEDALLDLKGIKGTGGVVRIQELTGTGTVYQDSALLEVADGRFQGNLVLGIGQSSQSTLKVKEDGNYTIESGKKVETNVENTAGASFENKGTVEREVTNAGTFANPGEVKGGVSNSGTFSNSGTVMGSVTNSRGGVFDNSGGGKVDGNVVNNGKLVNNGELSGDLTSSGTVTGSGTYKKALNVTGTIPTPLDPERSKIKPGNSPGKIVMGSSFSIDNANTIIEIASLKGDSDIVGGSITSGGVTWESSFGRFEAATTTQIEIKDNVDLRLYGYVRNPGTVPGSQSVPDPIARGSALKILDAGRGGLISGKYRYVIKGNPGDQSDIGDTSGQLKLDSAFILNLWSGELVNTGIESPDAGVLTDKGLKWVDRANAEWDITQDLLGAELGGWSGLNKNQKAMLNQLNIGERQFHGGTMSTLLLQAPDAAAARLVLDKASPEAFAGLADFGFHVLRSHLEQTREMNVISEDGKFGVFSGWANFSGGSRSSLNRADYRLSNNSAVFGVRYQAASNVSLDLFATQGSGTVRTDFMNANLDGQTFGLGASYKGDSEVPLSVKVGIVGASFNGDGSRVTNTGFSRFTGADSSVVQGGFIAAYQVHSEGSFGVSLDLSASYAKSSVSSFNETQSTSFSGENLHVAGQSNTATVCEFGVSSTVAITSKWRADSRLAVEHNFSDVSRDVTANVVGEPTSFTVQGNGMGKTRFSATIGSRYDVTKNWSLGVDYRGTVGADQRYGSSLFLNASYGF
jgi:autotransporter-associated beta strand protein